MGQPQRRKKKTAGDKQHSRALKVKHFYKDIDQIHDDLLQKNADKLLNQPIDEDLPGQGQFYCLQCARYFQSSAALEMHYKSKPHKQRVKVLREPVWSQAEAEKCAGMSRDK
jgi:bud site selection protein 20